MHLSPLRPVLQRPGPFVTVHTHVGRASEDARQQTDARWTTIWHTLERRGVDQDLLEVMHERIIEPPGVPGPARRTMVAEGPDLIFDQVLAGEVAWAETAEVAMLPDVGGWLMQADRQIPFLLVVADRDGAELSLHRGLSVPGTQETKLPGQDFQITEVAAGDWAEKQYAEDTWQRTANQVADAVRSGVRREQPALVLLAGDERALTEITHALEGLQVPVAQVTAGGRAAGASEEALWIEVCKILSDHEVHRDAQVVDELAQRIGQGAGAAGDLDGVLEALVRGQVERLVVDLQTARELRVDPTRHHGLPLPQAVVGEQPADRALVAAAAATDAACTVLPQATTGGSGVAALLRWDGSLA
jgi:hypothetical protein